MVTLKPINVPWSFTTIWSLMTTTKLRYGHTRTHQRQYRWFNVFNHCVMSHKWPHDGATETPALRMAMTQFKWAHFWGSLFKSRVNLPSHGGCHFMDPVFYRQENSAFNRQSTMAWSHMSNVTWPSMAIFMAIFLQTVPHDPSKLFCSIIGPNFKMVRYGWDGLNNDSTNVRNEHFFKPSHFNPSFRFLPCRT